MVVVEAFSSTSELVLEVGKIGMWVQAVGLFVVIWIVIVQGLLEQGSSSRLVSVEPARRDETKRDEINPRQRLFSYFSHFFLRNRCFKCSFHQNI